MSEFITVDGVDDSYPPEDEPQDEDEEPENIDCLVSGHSWEYISEECDRCVYCGEESCY